MKVSNFRLTEKVQYGSTNLFLYKGVVTVDTGFIFKKLKCRDVFKPHDGLSWRWLDDGEYTGDCVDNLVEVFMAKNNAVELYDCKI